MAKFIHATATTAVGPEGERVIDIIATDEDGRVWHMTDPAPEMNRWHQLPPHPGPEGKGRLQAAAHAWEELMRVYPAEGAEMGWRARTRLQVLVEGFRLDYPVPR